MKLIGLNFGKNSEDVKKERCLESNERVVVEKWRKKRRDGRSSTNWKSRTGDENIFKYEGKSAYGIERRNISSKNITVKKIA